MNFQSIKSGFRDYLKELNELSSNGREYNISGSNASIFLYADEFKTYLSEEVGLDESLFSKSIDKILKMEVDGNKLVDPNEIGNETEDSPEIDLTKESDEDLQMPEDEEFSDDSDSADSYEIDEEELAIGILNDLMNDFQFSDLLDINQDGELGNDEMQAFLNSIKGFDEDETNLSLMDVLGAAQSISDGEFNIEDVVNEMDSAPLCDTPEITPETGMSNPAAGGTSPAGGNYSSGGSFGSSGSAPSSEPQEKTLDNMSVPELQNELRTANSELSSKQDELSKVRNDETDVLSADKQAVDDAYEAYQTAIEEVDEELAQKVDDKQKAIDAKEEEIRAKDAEIFDMNQTITALQSSYDSAKSSYEALNAQLTDMQSAVSGLEGEQQTALQAKIDGLRPEVDSAKAAMDEAETALNKAKDEDLPRLEQEKSDLESGGDDSLSTLQAEMAELQQEVNDKCPEAKELYDTYTTAKEKLETDRQSELSKVQEAVSTAQARVNEVQSALAAAQTKETQTKYSPSKFLDYDSERGQALADAARSLYGGNPNPGGYCATGVSQALHAAYGYWQGGDAWQFGDGLAGRDDWTEVTDACSPEDIKNLPAGAICVWSRYDGGQYGHVFISDGNGNEISDFTSTVSTHYLQKNASYRIFVPN